MPAPDMLVYPRGTFDGWVTWDSLTEDIQRRLLDKGPQLDPATSRGIIVRSKAEIDRKTGDKADAKTAPLPAPEIPMRIATADDVASARAVHGVKNLAEKHGWTIRVTFSRGPRIGSDGQALDIRNALVIAGCHRQRTGHFFQALWMQDDRDGKWAFDHAHVWPDRYVERVNSSDLQDFIDPERVTRRETQRLLQEQENAQ